jgi:hypothetical protein
MSLAGLLDTFSPGSYLEFGFRSGGVLLRSAVRY